MEGIGWGERGRDDGKRPFTRDTAAAVGIEEEEEDFRDRQHLIPPPSGDT